MKIKQLLIAITLALSMAIIQPLTVSASFTPSPRASFTTPNSGSPISADYTDVTFSLSLSGHPGLVGKNLEVYPIICDSNYITSPYTTCEIETSSEVDAYFNDSSAYQSYTFPAVAMQYLGTNYISCYVYDRATSNGDFCRNGDFADYAYVNYTGALLPVYRFWSSSKKHHFYTQSAAERNQVINNYDDSVWKYEGIAYYTSRTEACRGSGVFRFWSNTKQGHFYTNSEQEKNHIINSYSQNEWKYEGVAFCADSTKQNSWQQPVYRFWSANQQGHFYTADEAEKNYLINNDRNWWYEGVAFYATTN